MSIRWRHINPDTTGQISNWQYFRFSVLAMIYNLIMPGSHGGDIVKGAYVLKHIKEKQGQNVFAIVFDRFIGLSTIIILGAFSVFFSRSNIFVNDRIFAAVALAVCVFCIVLLTNSRFISLIKKVKLAAKPGQIFNKCIDVWESSVWFFKSNKLSVFVAYVITLALHFISFSLFYFWAVFLDIQVSFIAIVVSVSMMWLVTSLPVSIGGFGIREISLVFFLGLYGIESEQAVSLSIVKYITTLFGVVLSLFFIINFRNKNTVPNSNDVKRYNVT